MKSKNPHFHAPFIQFRLSVPALGLAVAISSLAIQSAHADTNWTGTTNQDWNTATNWSNGLPEPGNGAIFINNITVNTPSLSTSVSAGWDILIGQNGNTGALVQTSGTLQPGNGNWAFIGVDGGSVGTYTLSGDADFRASRINLGAFSNGSTGGTGTLNINTTGTVDAYGDVGNWWQNNSWHVGADKGSAGTINLTNGTVNSFGNMWLGVFSGSGVLNQSGGTVNVGGNLALAKMWNGSSGTTVGTATITGGTLNAGSVTVGAAGAASDVVAGSLSVSGASTVVNSGDLTVGFAGNSSSTGQVNITSGGTVNVASTSELSVTFGQWDSITPTMNVTGGGKLNLNAGSDIRMGVGSNNASRVINVDGGSILGSGAANVDASVIEMGRGNNTGSDTLNIMNGGLVQAQAIYTNATTTSAIINFDNGTLKATGDDPNLINLAGTGTRQVNVKAGGAILDSNGHDVTIVNGLLAGDAGNGGVTKNGTGTLTLAGNSTFTGNTTVNAGQFTLADNASLKFVPGTSGVNNSITGTGAATLNGAFNIDLSAASTTSGSSWDLITTTGTVTIGSTFTVTGFTAGAGAVGARTWTSGSYQYNEATGILSVAASTDSDSDGMLDTWETTYFAGLTQGATGDFDGDGTDNLTEFRLGLIPNKGNSRFVVTASDSNLADGYTVNWQGKAGLTFSVQRSSSLAAGSWTVISTVTPVADGAQSYTDPAPVPAGKSFYRVLLQP